MTSLFASDSSDFRALIGSRQRKGPKHRCPNISMPHTSDMGARFGELHRIWLRLELEPIVERAKGLGFDGHNPASWLTGGSDSKDAGRENYEIQLERLNKFLIDKGLDPLIQEDLDSSVKAKAIAAEAGYQNVSAIG